MRILNGVLMSEPFARPMMGVEAEIPTQGRRKLVSLDFLYSLKHIHLRLYFKTKILCSLRGYKCSHWVPAKHHSEIEQFKE